MSHLMISYVVMKWISTQMLATRPLLATIGLGGFPSEPLIGAPNIYLVYIAILGSWLS